MGKVIVSTLGIGVSAATMTKSLAVLGGGSMFLGIGAVAVIGGAVALGIAALVRR